MLDVYSATISRESEFTVASTWGEGETKFFFSLTPEIVLNEIEKNSAFKCTGRVLTLNSMENRVYEVEIDLESPPKNPSERFIVVKFYRPGRWSKEQILEEHEFLSDLKANDIPVVPPLANEHGETLFKLSSAEIYFTLFPKMAGRIADEMQDEKLRTTARTIARLHNVGAMKQAKHRLRLDTDTYGISNMNYLLANNFIPDNFRDRYADIVQRICEISSPWFSKVSYQRIHGDCHLGNILEGREQLTLVDFDDMVQGPCVQDIWLIIPGRDEFAKQQMDEFISAYEIMRPFDRSSLRLIEPLRALRYVHFSAWIARRWQDPIFPKFFPHFGSEQYWQEQISDLHEQYDLISRQASLY